MKREKEKYRIKLTRKERIKVKFLKKKKQVIEYLMQLLHLTYMLF